MKMCTDLVLTEMNFIFERIRALCVYVCVCVCGGGGVALYGMELVYSTPFRFD